MFLSRVFPGVFIFLIMNKNRGSKLIESTVVEESIMFGIFTYCILTLYGCGFAFVQNSCFVFNSHVM